MKTKEEGRRKEVEKGRLDSEECNDGVGEKEGWKTRDRKKIQKKEESERVRKVIWEKGKIELKSKNR